MHIYLIGLNHRSAPIEVREKLAFTESELPEALKLLRQGTSAMECAILSTCNRTEVYALVPAVGTDDELKEFLSSHHDVPINEFSSHCYLHKDAFAVCHLFRVASGTDSLVIGEPQILGQVKQAYDTAMKCQATGPILNALFRAAISTGKRARSETEIGKGGFSIGHAAVDLARSIFGNLQGSKVLILGAGKMSELTAKHLQASGIGVVFVANRTFQRATSLADRLGGQAVQYDQFPNVLTEADIVISSTASPVHILTRETLQPILKKRRGRPLFLIDIALPRDIDPEVGQLENVFLYDIDDLESVVEDMTRGREAERVHVEEIIAEESADFMAWWRSLEAVPVVTRLKDKHERIRRSELERLRNQLPDLDPATWRRIEAAMKSLVSRVGKEPVERLKDAAAEGNLAAPESLLEAATLIFGLDECPEGEQVEKSAQPEPAPIISTELEVPAAVEAPVRKEPAEASR